MDNLAVFDYLRPIYIFFIIILAILLITIIFQNNRIKLFNSLSIISISFICTAVSVFMTYQMGYIVDELSLKGDSVSCYLLIAVTLMSIINIAAYLIKNVQK